MCGMDAVQAVILSGGKGTRLRPMVSDRPKVLASVNGRPFICHLLDYLIGFGIRRAVLCTGHMAEQVSAELGDSYQHMELAYSREKEPLDTAGAVRLALDLIDSDPALVMNGDSFFRTDLASFYRNHNDTSAKATLLLTNVEDTRRYGSVRIDAAGRIVSFEEKQETSGPGLISAGMYLVGRELLESIPAERPVSFEREAFPSWIGRDLFGFAGDGVFLDIGTPESLASADAFFSGQTS